MNDYATLPLEAHDNRSVFLENAWNIGRAYRNQALELISICQHVSQTAQPKLVYKDIELRRMLRVCDLALRLAADSGTKVTDEADAQLKEATQVLSRSRHHLDLSLTVYSRMEMAKRKDSIENHGVWSHVARLVAWVSFHSSRTLLLQKPEEESGPTMTIKFVVVQSPLLAPSSPETVIVSQELSTSPSLSEILWNFSRYDDRARITLEQNPHFYLRCPTDESAYTPMYQHHPLQDPSGALKHNDTVYVLFDRPGRVFLDTDRTLRVFGNVWSLNGCLIFRDRSGVLEGEKLVRSSSIQGGSWYCKRPVVYHESESRSRLNYSDVRPIITTPPVDSFEDWTALSRPESHSINTYIYRSWQSPGYTSSLDLAPPPPTSERPAYDVLYTTTNTLNNDILLDIFNYYRLDDENGWNVRLGWCKLSHICRRWRHLIFESAFHLGMHILCTNGTPIVDTLDHLPPLPLFIDYRDTTTTLSGKDELGIYHALLVRDRVRRIYLDLSPSILHKFLMLMDEPFPILEHLSLSSTVDETVGLTLPKTFLAPRLRHLILHAVGPPKGFLFLSRVFPATLALKNIWASGYFLPRELLTSPWSLTYLMELSIDFSIPIPRPSAEGVLLGKQRTPRILPCLKILKFQGVGAYLEDLVAQIRAPSLEQLSITLFNQIVFALPHLSHFASIVRLKYPIAKITFGHDAVSIIAYHDITQVFNGSFSFQVMCKQLDWQIDSAAQICNAFLPALTGVEKLMLDFREQTMPNEWRNGEIDGTTWHELLKAFISVKELHICAALSEELSRALQVNEVGSDPGLLPGLQDLVSEFTWGSMDTPFGSFIQARRVAGRPVGSSFPFSQSFLYSRVSRFPEFPAHDAPFAPLPPPPVPI